jgi:indoleamine 2,3-dioxygenase
MLEMDSPPQSRKDRFPYADLREYGISAERGFLPEENPLLSLPPYYQAWDQLGSQLPKLLVKGSRHVRAAVAGLPVLDTVHLDNRPQVERAMVLLSYIAHAYVWCDADGSASGANLVDTLPACVAVPWYQVSRKLGRLPCLHFATVVQNWSLIDEAQPLALDNITMNQTFYGGIDEEWFFLIPIAMEAKGGGIISSIVAAQRAVNEKSVVETIECLQALHAHLSDITAILKQMRERCHPTIFYVRLRPFLHGWSNLPNGLIFEGVDELNGEPQKYAGGSAAQTPLIQVIDAGLETKHGGTFLKEMRRYMDPRHVKFLEEIEAECTIKQFVKHNEDCTELTEAFDACLKKMGEFRSYHIQLAASYIVAQTASARGTGGSDFVTFLKRVRDETTHSVIRQNGSTL